MNDLSWLLYWGGVSGNASVILASAVSIGFGVLGLWTVIACIEGHGDNYTGPKWLFSIPAIAALLLIFTPSQNTVYAIAASEMGEKALDSKLATKAEKALDAWLDRQLGANQEQPQ